MKPPVPSSPDPAPRSDDDEETLPPGSYAVMRDTSASDTLFLEDLEDPDDRSSLAHEVVDNNSVFEDDNDDDDTQQEDDDKRSKKEKSCITSKSRIIVIIFLVCCAIACTTLVDVLLLLQGRKTMAVPVSDTTSICDASPTDPFVHCNDCGPRKAEISDGLRSVYTIR